MTQVHELHKPLQYHNVEAATQDVWKKTTLDEKRAVFLNMLTQFKFKGKNEQIKQRVMADDVTIQELDKIATNMMLYDTDRVIGGSRKRY